MLGTDIGGSGAFWTSGAAMDLRFVEVDELLDQVNARFYAEDEARRQEWYAGEATAWLYHELQLEGVPVHKGDLPRAAAEEEGADYCDRVLLAQIRRGADLLVDVRSRAEDEEPLRMGVLSQWQQQLSGEDEVQVRTTEGATEHYKHDVAPAREAIAEASRVLASAEEIRHTEHPLRVASELVYGLGKAWPFTTWSAACARLAASSALIGRGYPPLIVPVRERANFYLAYHYDPSRLEALVLRCVRAHLQAKLAFLDGKMQLSGMWTEGE